MTHEWFEKCINNLQHNNDGTGQLKVHEISADSLAFIAFETLDSQLYHQSDRHLSVEEPEKAYCVEEPLDTKPLRSQFPSIDERLFPVFYFWMPTLSANNRAVLSMPGNTRSQFQGIIWPFIYSPPPECA